MTGMDGVLIIDKPAGLTSHDVVARVRKTIGERRAGHTGTLDPFATGVLVVMIGRATRLAQFLSNAEKEYEAVIRLGYATDSGDVTGTRVTHLTTEAQRPTEIRREEIEAAMAALRGEIEQTPPMYSAKKVGGRKLYELARRGEEIERKAARVIVSELTVIDSDSSLLKENADGSRDLRVRVVCSAGTYIRALAEDFGRKLGVGAHLAELRRTRAGQFRIESAITLDRLAELADSDSIETELISPDVTLSHLPFTELNSVEVARTVRGIDLEIDAALDPAWPDKQPIRLRGAEGQLIAVGVYDESRHSIHPKVVLDN
jgi:tRNA pseudouridine55 synthase